MLDTSVFVALESGRPLRTDLWPAEASISAVTLAELELGVHLAASERVRTRRLATLRTTAETYVALPVDESVASAYAGLVAEARRTGRRPGVQDAWIAATAVANSATVFTQDAGFDGLPGVDVVWV